MTNSTRKYTTITREGKTNIAIRSPFDGFRVRVEIREETSIYDSSLVYIESLKNEAAATKWLKKNNFLQFA